MVRESHSLYICIYIFVLFFKSFFFFTGTNQIRIIFKQIYLTHSWEPHRYSHCGWEWIHHTLLNSTNEAVVYQRKMTTLVYKNVVGFFFLPFITQNVQMGKVKEIQRWLSCTHRGQRKNLQWTSFSTFCSSWNLPGYIKSQTSMQILMITPPPACCLHNAYGYVAF